MIFLPVFNLNHCGKALFPLFGRLKLFERHPYLNKKVTRKVSCTYIIAFARRAEKKLFILLRRWKIVAQNIKFQGCLSQSYDVADFEFLQ